MYTTAITIVILCIGIAIMGVAWQSFRGRKLVSRWARQHEFRLVKCEVRYLRLGTFFWTTSDKQRVYHVIVEDKSGGRLSAYVRCGSWWWGMLSDKVEVHWDR